MKQAIRKLSVVLSLITLLASSALAQDPPQKYKLTGQPLPDFTLPTLGGKPLRSTDLKGKATAVFAFCSCADCKYVADQWTKIQQSNHADTVIIFLGDESEAKEFKAAHNFDPAHTTIAVDEDFKAATALRASPCPSAYVIDQAGTMRFVTKEPSLGKTMTREEIPTQMQTIYSVVAQSNPAPAASKAVASLPAITLTPIPTKTNKLFEDNGLYWEDKRFKVKSVRKTFAFKNNTDKPVALEKAAGTCTCTDIIVTKGGKRFEEGDIAPGETITISVTVTIPLDWPAKNAEVWVFGYPKDPIAYIKMYLERPAKG